MSSTWAAETWAPPVSMVISAEDKDPGVIEMEAGKERVTEAGLEVISLWLKLMVQKLAEPATGFCISATARCTILGSRLRRLHHIILRLVMQLLTR